MAPDTPVSVLFVCTGNICRSSMAEVILKHLVKERRLERHFDTIDSAGMIGYHVGDAYDYRYVPPVRAARPRGQGWNVCACPGAARARPQRGAPPRVAGR